MIGVVIVVEVCGVLTDKLESLKMKEEAFEDKI